MWSCRDCFQWLGRLISALCIVLTAGCGFQLQGTQALPSEMQRTYLAAGDTYTEFYRALSQTLEKNGVELVGSAGEASAVLRIRRDETGQRVLSVSAQNIPREFEVYYTVTYDLSFDGAIQSGAEDLTMTRDYTWNETELLGKAKEEAVIRSALVDDLAATVLRRLYFTK